MRLSVVIKIDTATVGTALQSKVASVEQHPALTREEETWIAAR